MLIQKEKIKCFNLKKQFMRESLVRQSKTFRISEYNVIFYNSSLKEPSHKNLNRLFLGFNELALTKE